MSPSPTIIKNTPVIMGFRQYRYGPSTISFLVGSHGANVPCPNILNRKTVYTNNAEPATAINHPTSLRVMVCGINPSLLSYNKYGTMNVTVNGIRMISRKCFKFDGDSIFQLI